MAEPALPDPSRPVDETISACVRDACTGALEFRRGKKRWLFFFQAGQLVYTRSNLRGEQEDALRQKLGIDLPPDELNRAQVGKRLRAVIKSAGRDGGVEIAWHEGAEPPHTTPVDITGLLVDAVHDVVPPDQLAARVAPFLETWPRCVAPGGILGVAPALEGYFGDLDGMRPGSDVVAFAPAPPEQVMAALLVLVGAGLVVADEQAADAQTITAVDGQEQSGLFSAATAPTEQVSAADVASDVRADAADDERAAAAARSARSVSGDPGQGDVPTATYTSVGDGSSSRFKDQLTGDIDVGALIDAAVSGRPLPSPDAGETDEITAAHALPGNQPHPLAERLTELGRRIQLADNHFQVLDVPWDAPPDAFRTAYHDLARDLHPDRFHDGPDALQDLATELFDRLRMAWEVLGNDEKRIAYIDRVIHGKKTEEEKAMEQLNAYWEAEDTFRKGLTLFNNGRTSDAHPHFEAAARSQPDELQFQAYYGYTTFALNRTSDPQAAEAGIALLRDVLERNKSQERQMDAGWALLGRAYREKGDLSVARKALVQALRINPANADASREMRRLEKARTEEESSGGGFFSRFFKKKK